ncbi:unconventional myosin-VIIa [Trichomycterus rosablanca]|uniref:unconventional myosin-VIIa n=1 Tax=Trichomycterus rosablanca TaxID=2290929 RepID=UPI002F357FA5
MVLPSKGDHVWVDSGIGVPIGARIKLIDGKQIQLIDDDGKELRISEGAPMSLRLMHPTSVEGVDDMIRLGDLSEAGVLRNLLTRHRQGFIYTYIGSVLVAVNPYQVLPIYTAEQVHLYHGRRLGELPPHVFAIAESCYYNMCRYQRNQCCIISGESGAGKTESTKLILQFLAAVSGRNSWIEQRILQANPVLEAFGNAKTVRNDNSSRFGKYIEIFFSREGVIEGAHMEQYLLEKSRVCHQAPEERNYHIFYCMLRGMQEEQKKVLALGDASQFKYLTEGNCITCDGRDDEEEFGRIRSALRVLTFTERECWDIFKLLAAVLHMGNVSFEAGIMNNMDACGVLSSDHFTMVAKLLEVDKMFLATGLTFRTFVTKQERVTRPLSLEQALDCRDALAKAVYRKLFVWIFEKINGAIYKPQLNTRRSIGLLDIFGFENFTKNSFEQLCINYANEQLQQFFVEHIFKLEQEEYLKEGITWKHMSFTDNQLTLDLLALKPLNVLALIDEESHFPKGTDVSMLNKLTESHHNNTIYVSPGRSHSLQFGIRHFAGVVHYDCNGFLEKNRDALSLDIITLIQKSSSQLLRRIFDAELSANAPKPVNSKIIFSGKKLFRSMQQVNGVRRQTSTLSGQFRQSLDTLMKTLSLCQPFFIRCFKPNNTKLSAVFDRELCAQQLSYSGMLETIRIRKSGFPIRHKFEEFLGRYRVLLKTTDCDPKREPAATCCDAICRAVIQDQDDWRVGKTKIFLRDHHDSFLELERERELNRKALIIQRVMMGHRDRKEFVRKRSAAVTVQKYWRRYREQIRLRKLRRGFVRLQAAVRARQDRLRYLRQRAAAVKLQSHMRAYVARKRYRRERDAAVLLQAQTRRLLARKGAKRVKDDVRTFCLASSGGRKCTQHPLQAGDTPAKFQLAQEKQRGELAALECQRRPDLRPEVVIKLSEESEDKTDHSSDEELVESSFIFLSKSTEKQEEPAQKPAQKPVSRAVEQKKVKVTEEVVQIVVTPAEDEEPEEEEENEDDDDDDDLSFSNFATLHFQNSATHSHIQQRLKQPLLYHEDEGDSLACLTVWWIILRFMGDIPEPRQARLSVTADLIQQNLDQRQGRRLSHLVGLDQKILRRKQKQQKLDTKRRKHSAILEELNEETPNGLNTLEEEDVLIGEGPSFDRPMTPLEKLHIIVGYALRRPNIRDEIYCQICKQLMKNKDRLSCNRGWVLLTVCLGIFPPTERLTKYLRKFVRGGLVEFSSSCAEHLRRTLLNGERKEVPCWVELNAVEDQKPLQVKVTLTDGRVLTLPVDSCSTSAEVCSSIAQLIGLKDMFGFSLYISCFDKNWSLGSSGHHVLDAISQCEQEQRRNGQEEEFTPWRLSFKKELFTPWHDCMDDLISTDLIYTQIVHDLKSGEYQCDKEDDYVQLAAKHHYIKYGAESSRETTRSVVWECMNVTLIESKSEAKLVQLVSSALGLYISSGASADLVKAEVVNYARLRWSIFFSKFFEASLFAGPPLPQEKFVVAVNCHGVSFQQGREQIFLQLSYPEITEVQIRSVGQVGEVACLSTLRGEYKLKVGKSHSMVELLSTFLTGLKERSIYAVAALDGSKPDDPAFWACKKDLIYLIKDDGFPPDAGSIRGRNERTGQTETLSTDTVMILPTMSLPSDELLALLNPNPRKSVMNAPVKEDMNSDRLALISLKEFAAEHFREAGKEAGRAGRGGTREKLWARSKEPLKQPLMKSLQKNSDLNQLAIISFTAIMKYMGDHPIKITRNPVELTDQIYGPALQHPDLRDEVYCQIMKQMSSNNNGMSLERGWQLLWLCCGLFPPSSVLLRHVQRFLESRHREPLSVACLQRLQGMLSIDPRSMPPHQVEVEAIQKNSSQIFHRIHFPNDTSEIIEVTTTLRVRDLCQNIAANLTLSSADGYSLFVKTASKVVSMEHQQYFFDNLKLLTDAPKKGKKVKEGSPTTVPYLVLFMRKLWFNVIPGKDLTADLTFHFPQEVPKYLRGFHSVSKEEMTSLAGLLFRVRVDTDRSQFVMIPRMLKDLVPSDQLKIMSSEDWKKNIIGAYNKQAGTTVDEAKVSFLKTISRWPTFGCAFFEVKQTSDRFYPNVITISISKQGVSLIDPKTKEVLIMHPFSKITNWSSGSTYFHLTIGNLVKGSTLLCETSMGYKMDDLLNSYVNMYLDERTTVQPRYQFFT